MAFVRNVSITRKVTKIVEEQVPAVVLADDGSSGIMAYALPNGVAVRPYIRGGGKNHVIRHQFTMFSADDAEQFANQLQELVELCRTGVGIGGYSEAIAAAGFDDPEYQVVPV